MNCNPAIQRPLPDVYHFAKVNRDFDLKYNAALRDAAERLETGQLSEVIELVSHATQDAGYYILKGLERTDEGNRSFEEVRDHVTASYLKLKFQEFMDSKVHDATVEVNEEVYKRLMVHLYE